MADYWFIPLHYQGNTHWKWLLADTIEEARADAVGCWGPGTELNEGVEVGEPVRAGDLEPCTRCPSREVCISPNNRWEHTHLIKGPLDEKDDRLVINVHTCRTCMERVLSDWGWKMTERHLVAEGCPRWDALYGSAHNCGWCNAETQRLQREHPSYEAVMSAIRTGFIDVLRTPSTAPEGTVDLEQRRKIREASESYTKAAIPFGFLRDLADFDESAGNQAIVLLWGLLAELPQYTELSSEIAEHSDAPRLVATRFKWVEDLYLALTRHRDKPDAADQVLHEWVIRFLDNGGGPVSRGWTRTVVARRKMLIRSWRKTIGECLAEGPQDQVPVAIVRGLFDL